MSTSESGDCFPVTGDASVILAYGSVVCVCAHLLHQHARGNLCPPVIVL